MEDQIEEDNADYPMLHQITTALEDDCDEQDELTSALENSAFYGLFEKG